MPVVWSSGWLLERMMELQGQPEKWNNQPIGFGLDDPDWDPAFDESMSVEPPTGWENLPVYEGG
jgi:hypothetical protein